MKRTLLTAALFFFVCAGLAGCHTLKGVKSDVELVPPMVVKAGHGILKTDAWLRENLW